MGLTLGELANVVRFQTNNSDVQKVNNTIKSISSTAKRLLGVIGIGFSLTQLNALAEEFDGIGDRITYAAGEAENLDEIQQKILSSANAARTAYGTFANEVTNLKQANADVFPLEDAATFVEYVNKLGKAAGYSDGEISTMQSSIQRVIAAGGMSQSDINRMARTTPALITTICDGLGVTREQLEQMAASGQITADTIKTAMLNSTDAIDNAYSNLNFGIGDALTQIRNKWGFWVDETNKMFDITQSIAKFFVSAFDKVLSVLTRVRNGVQWLSQKLGGTEKLIKLVSIAVGAVAAAFAASKIISGIKSIDAATLAHYKSLLKTVAIIVLIALLVEDFINFMQGNNSLLGSLLEKAGVDTEAVRQQFKDLWAQLKEVIPVVKEFAKGIGKTVLDALKRLMPLLGKLIASVLPIIIKILSTAITLIVKIASSVLPVVLGLIERIVPVLLTIAEAILPAICTVIESLLPLVMQIIDTVLPLIISLIDTLLPLILQIVDAVLPVILSLIEAILPLLTQIIEAVLPVVLELINAILPVLQPIFDIVANLVSAVLPLVVSLLNAILPILQPILGVLQPIADVLGVIIGAISKVVGWVSSGLGWIVDKIFGGGGGGVDTSGAAAVNAYAGGTDDSDEDFIAGEEGPELVTNRRGSKVYTAIQTGQIFKNLAKLSALAKAGKVSPSTVNTVSNSSSISKSVAQNVNINNTFNGDKAIQKKAATTMDKSAGDVTAELARALAYTR